MPSVQLRTILDSYLADDTGANTLLLTKKLSPQPARRARREQSGSRLDEVLSVASTHFSARGYALATLEEIGAELGMTRPALYYYAKSKEDLLIQCYNRIHTEFERRIRERVVGTNGLERLKQFFQVYGEIICDDAAGGFLASLADRSYYRNEMLRQEFGQRVRSVNKMVSDILEEGIADGTIAACDKRFAIAALFGTFRTLRQLKRANGVGIAEVEAKMMQLILDGLAPRGKASR